MNKTAIKNFAVWARNKLIADITYRAGLVGVSDKGIAQPLPQSSKDLQFFDIGTKDYAQVAGKEVDQRKALVKAIQDKEHDSDYATAFKAVIEEVAYTWFNRLIAIRFMEVNDYLPSRVRVLSSENQAKNEPDFVTTPFDTDMEFTAAEQDTIMQLKDENKLDDLFRMLFIKQCNKLHEILPELFENTNDYTELLLSISFTDRDGIVYHLVHDIDEDDFNIEKEGQVEIIGWMYQYYNIEPKDETFALLKKNVKITKERIPAATQLFTPDWIVRYMVENSLGRLWVEGHPNEDLKSNWKYYLEEAEQEADVQAQLEKIRAEYRNLNPEDIKLIDPCMGSGHILVYCFDVLMQIYESQGYTQRDAAQSILENNLFGLDIDKRAAQLSYFAVMMKARQYDRRIFGREIKPHVYVIEESNDVNNSQLKYFGAGLNPVEKNSALNEIKGLLDTLTDAKEYGSILNIENYDWDLLRCFVNEADDSGQMTLDTIGIDDTKMKLCQLVEIGQAMAQKYDVVVTNPPYMKADNMPIKLSDYILKYKECAKYDLYSAFIFRCHSYAKKNAYISMITMHNFMFAPSFLEMRNEIKYWSWVSMIHLGSRAFSEISGEVVQTALYIIAKRAITTNMSVVNVTEEKIPEEKEKKFLKEKSKGYTFNLLNIASIPGQAFGYALGEKVIDLYQKNKTIDRYGLSKAGVVTGADDTFVRYWFEVNNTEITYAPYPKEIYKYVLFSKGGTFNKWYGNSQNVLKLADMWDDNKTNKSVRRGDIDYYYKKGIGWSQMGGGVNKAFSVIVDSVCKTTTPMLYLHDSDKFSYMIGYLNSTIPPMVLKSLNPTLSILTSDIINLPFVYEAEYKDEIDYLVGECISLSEQRYSQLEENWQFKCNNLIQKVKRVSDAYLTWLEYDKQMTSTIAQNEEKLNCLFEEIMQLQNDIEDKHKELYIMDVKDCIVRLLSYAVGCMFGRYSLDTDGLAYAGGEWDESKYSTFIPDKDNCIPITDEPYFEDDVVGLFCAWMKKVYGEDTLEENLDFIAKALGNKGSTSREVIRNYFLNDFIKDHIKTYQKRPIYWLFDSGKQNGFKALVYMHRWDADTVGNLRVEYLHKTQRIYEREIQRMQETMGNSHDSREINKASKRKEKLQKQLKETKDYDTKLAHIALSRIDIDLDDGVKVNYKKVQTGRDGKKMQILAKI